MENNIIRTKADLREWLQADGQYYKSQWGGYATV